MRNTNCRRAAHAHVARGLGFLLVLGGAAVTMDNAHAGELALGKKADKLASLELFWRASIYSQIAVMMARN